MPCRTPTHLHVLKARLVARTRRTIDGVYARYMPDPTDDTRRDRALTLAYDTLSDPPAWVVEHVRYLHDT